MYNRAMVPAPNPRLTELFDQLRQEYESQSNRHGECEHQRMQNSTHRLLFIHISHILPAQQWMRTVQWGIFSVAAVIND